jgi:hypothetical protein
MCQQLQLIRDRHSDPRPSKIETQNAIHAEVIPSVVEESRGKTQGNIAGSFDFAQDDNPSLSLQFRRKFAD